MADYHKKKDYSRYRPTGYPVRHRRKVPFYPMLSLSMDVRGQIRAIRGMDEQLSGFMLSEKDYLDLVKDAYASNVHWSTKIEGNELTIDEVRELTTRYTRGEVRESPNGPVQEIINHLRLMISDDLFGLPWSTDTVRDVHGVLMSGVGQTAPGEIRGCEAAVVGRDGFEYFIAAPASEVGAELESLVDWVNGSPFDEVVTSALFFHEFESIHPFEDGNGRTGRTMFQILMRELGLRNCPLCKFEEELLSDSRAYYELLAYTDQTQNYTPFVEYVAESLFVAYQRAVEEFSSKDRLRGMEENTRLLAVRAKECKQFSFHEAASWLDLGESSVRSKLDDLVDMGILGKEGKTRAMRYIFLDPFRDLRGTVDLDDVGVSGDAEV